MMKVLELGCGNSQLSEELYKEGINEITCIDLSSVAVEKMRARLQSKGYKGLSVDRYVIYTLYRKALFFRSYFHISFSFILLVQDNLAGQLLFRNGVSQ